jgi:hypothetical protein
MLEENMNNNSNNSSEKAMGQSKWVIVLIAFDDDQIEPQVVKELIGTDENEQMAAFLRGGDLVDVLSDCTEEHAEARRVEVEKTSLRLR